MWLVRTDSLDVRRNLAVEECLLDRAAEDGPILFLWRDRPCVVIGKNQNPWQECRPAAMAADGVGLARRISGGGAVYHDEGNLNFSLAMPRTRYEPARPFDVALGALADLGFDARLADKSSLFIGDRKVSGNAFCLRRTAALHHGTLLVHSDLDRLQRYLAPPPGAAFETRAIASRPARVANLTDLRPGLTLARVTDALVARAEAAYGRLETRWTDAEIENLPWREIAARHAAWDWLYGATPDFETAADLPGADGIPRPVRLRVHRGRIESIEPLHPDLAPWLGRPYDPAAPA